MPTFRSKEIVDARQFNGGKEPGLALIFWVNSNEGFGIWHDAQPNFVVPEMLLVREPRGVVRVFIGDWVVLRQDGTFKIVRPEEFNFTYEQV